MASIVGLSFIINLYVIWLRQNVVFTTILLYWNMYLALLIAIILSQNSWILMNVGAYSGTPVQIMTITNFTMRWHIFILTFEKRKFYSSFPKIMNSELNNVLGFASVYTILGAIQVGIPRFKITVTSDFRRQYLDNNNSIIIIARLKKERIVAQRRTTAHHKESWQF